MRTNRFLGLWLVLVSCSVWANNLGQYGQVFPVVEQDLRQVILNRLNAMANTGDLARHEEHMKEQVKEHLLHPKRLPLSKGTTSRSFLIDPSITLNKDLRLPDGRLIVAQGTSINPFDYHAMKKTLVFFDAEDSHQMAWVKQHAQKLAPYKLILTGGSVRDASKILGVVYFDIQGALTTRFHIQQVPAIVRQEGRFWRVQELGVGS